MEFNDSLLDNERAISLEDKRALNIMESTAVLKEGHCEIAMPWRYSPLCLPNNRILAVHRLELLRRGLVKDPVLFQKYSAFVDNLLDKAYARKVPDNRLCRSGEATWFLPHHPVFHPKKPGKVRVVFDCAAKYKGVSLNDVLLQGPDMTNTLIGVLTRFLQERTAIIADVESMFYQVRVRPDDSDVLRFLWWPDNDLQRRPEEYQMTVHLFGAVSSPSCANFALRKTAEENFQRFDFEVINTVRRNFYVDDCLKSVPSESEAIRLTADLRRLLEKGGFNLTKWVSNSRKLIESLPESDRAGSFKDLHDSQMPVERALGVRWDVEGDVFCFKIELNDKPLTRRGLLSVKKIVAWILRYRDRLRASCGRCIRRASLALKSNVEGESESINVDEINRAEKEVLKFVQRQSFEEEMSRLEQKGGGSGDNSTKRSKEKGLVVKKTSAIYKLAPMKIDGLLYVGGRLTQASIPNAAKHQLILPKKHHVVDLIVRHYHLKSGHSGVEHVLSLIRERFWILKARTAVKSVLRSCFDCRRRQAPLGEQQMADLPTDRVTLEKPPFTFVGVDCFGPFVVRRGRGLVKRYGVLFTCLSVRAIHLEVAHSLDTDSFINAMRRFIARRGQPEEVRSDNGGNFVRGERELR